jgi:beta-lactamase regulating signal transducer with metallopeptidase domain
MFDALAVGIESRVVEAAGWMLVHSVWQGALVAGIVAVVNRMLVCRSAESRYVANCCGLLLLVTLPAITVSVLLPDEPARFRGAQQADRDASEPSDLGAESVAATQPTAAGKAVSQPLLPRLAETIEKHLTWIVGLWVCGVMVLSLRTLAGWGRIQHLCARATPLTGTVQQRVGALQRRLGMDRLVRVMESPGVGVPTLVRWLRPCILLPIGFASGLSVEQVDAILLHELVHVRRHDYAINLLQRLVESVLFYHPAAWWISHRVRVEREFACDDSTVNLSGDRHTYVNALLQLETRRPPASPALAASDSSLLSRVRRLAYHGGEAANKRSVIEMTVLPSLLVAVLVVLLTGLTSVRPATAAGHIVPYDLPGGATMNFVWVEGGTFYKGTSPAQQAKLTGLSYSGRDLWLSRFIGEEMSDAGVETVDGFYIAQTEVTVGQWESVLGEPPARTGSAPPAGVPDYPASAPYNEFERFIQAVQADAAPDYTFSMPTDEQWEFACIGGATVVDQDMIWWWGDEDPEDHLPDYAIFLPPEVPEPRHVKKVRSRQANPLGLYDMLGNLWEWSDAPDGTARARGGTWDYGPEWERCETRPLYAPRNRVTKWFIGGRLVMTGPPPCDAPTSDAGSDQTFSCAFGNTLVPLDGSGSSGDDVTYSWTDDGVEIATGPTPTVVLPIGVHTIILSVSSSCATDTDEVVVTILGDTEPPVITLNDGSSSHECGFDYSDPGATAFDVCDGDLTDAIGVAMDLDPYRPGSYQITYSVDDAAGNPASATRDIEVEDTLPPTLVADAWPNSLWPPNNKMVDIAVTLTASDKCGDPAVRLVSATGDDGTRPKDIEADIGTADETVALRAKRKGKGNGRTYTLEYEVEDASGNTVSASAEVSVAHDKGSRRPAGVTALPTATALHGASPNPFNPSTTIRFDLVEPASVRLEVFDALGRRIGLLEAGYLAAGSHVREWDGTDVSGRPVASGVYFTRLVAGDFHAMKRMLLLR